MAKSKTEPATTWGGKAKEWGGGDFTFLSSDGEAIIFIVCGLPEKMVSNYKGKPGERIGCPVITDNGYQLFVCGKRTFRKLAKFEKQFSTNAIAVVRHGAEGDVNAKYDVKVLPEKETFDTLCAIRDEDFDAEMIPESIKAALEVMAG